MKNFNVKMFTYAFNLDNQNTKKFIQNIDNHLSIQENLKSTHCLYINVENLIQKYELKELMYLVEKLDGISQKFKLEVAIGDYDNDLYKGLRNLSKYTQVRLCLNQKVARLLLNPAGFKEGAKVLLYDEDGVNEQRLLSKLTQDGFEVICSDSPEEFKEQKRDSSKYDVVLTMSALNQAESALVHMGKLKISKALIQNASTFVDTSIKALSVMTKLEVEKESHEVKALDPTLENDTCSVVISFKGSLVGTIVFIYPSEAAAKITQEDAVNIQAVENISKKVANGIKKVLGTKELNLEFTSVKSYATMSLLMDNLPNENGLWMNMLIDESDFYIFITK